MNKQTIPWFCLMGPTASGKTDLAVALAQRFPFEIISIDSAMIYRGLDIGSAKPDASVLSVAPHHLIDILDPIQSYSVAQSSEQVLACAQAIQARGHIPLLVGGTMMYFHALQQGLAVLPAADETIRAQLSAELDLQSSMGLHKKLQEVDSISAARIHPHDSQRIIRALEVFQLSQKPLSQWLAEATSSPTFSYVNMILMPDDRPWLHHRIARRFETMLELGLIDELSQLRQRWPLTSAHPSMRSVGYRQVWEYLENPESLDLLLEKGIAATRQLAKRQLTWLRSWPDAYFFTAEAPNLLREMIALVQRIADN